MPACHRHLPLVGLTMALLAVACRPPEPRMVITVAGSTSILPFVEYLAELYSGHNPGVRVAVQGGGSTAGIQAVLAGAAELAMSSRPLDAAESRQLQSVVLAWDALAVVVHPSNPVPGLSWADLRRIFAGEVRDWSPVGGRPGPITLISREDGSGTRQVFEERVMGSRPTDRRSLVLDASGAVREVVAADPAAIGYLSLGLVDGRLRAVPLDGRLPTVAAVLAGEYCLVRPFLLVMGAEPRPEVSHFVAFLLGPASQSVLAGEGLVPAAPGEESD
jgi:phosphate transport system substrate-binding protein